MTVDTIPATRKPLQRAFIYLRTRPQSWLTAVLFVLGWAALKDNISALAGAFFGSGAAMLGAWITDENIRRSAADDKLQRQHDARRYLTPELYRTIERVLYIHDRALVNFVCASANSAVKPNDLKQDFIPFRPALYPEAPQFRDLPGDEASALVAFYDSLHTLADAVEMWWGREGQLATNIFLTFMSKSSASLQLALTCISMFDLDNRCPPPHEAWGSVTSRIKRSLESETQALHHHKARAQAQAATPAASKGRPR